MTNITLTSSTMKGPRYRRGSTQWKFRFGRHNFWLRQAQEGKTQQATRNPTSSLCSSILDGVLLKKSLCAAAEAPPPPFTSVPHLTARRLHHASEQPRAFCSGSKRNAAPRSPACRSPRARYVRCPGTRVRAGRGAPGGGRREAAGWGCVRRPLTSRAIWLSASSSAVRRSRFGSRFLPAPCVPMADGWDAVEPGSAFPAPHGSRPPPQPLAGAGPEEPNRHRPRPAHAPPPPAREGPGGALSRGLPAAAPQAARLAAAAAKLRVWLETVPLPLSEKLRASLPKWGKRALELHRRVLKAGEDH